MNYQDVTVILPSLNPNKTLNQVVDSLLEVGFRDIIVINDGSAPEYLEPFLRADEHPQVTLLTHPVNRGKGAAMKTAFAYLLEHRPESAGAVTVDGDGQHLAADVKNCAQKMVDLQDRVVLGCRDFSDPGVPWKSRTGNRLTSFVFRLFCGLSVSDTQTGLRAIPYKYLPLMCQIGGERYEYETEMFFVLKREGVGVAEQVIQTVYEPGNPSSHFNAFRDSIAIYRRIISFSVAEHPTLRKAVTFALSSGVSLLLDYGIFTFLNLQLSSPHFWSLSRRWRLFVAYFCARAVSSLVNYTLNKNAVFHSSEPTRRTIVRYYTLCVVQAGVCYGLLYLLSSLLTAGSALEVLLKMLVDGVLFLVSFQIQNRWVFR